MTIDKQNIRTFRGGRQADLLLGISMFLNLLFSCQPACADESRADEPAIMETGATCESTASFDRLMRSFVRENEIPGAALAVAKDGRLIYARGFGLADRETNRPVQPDSLFRIASISKPITAVAILRLVEQGKLGLDDCVCQWLDPPGEPQVAAAADSRWDQVTIRQLLQHTGGWDRDASFDPMFRSVQIAAETGSSPPAEPRDVVTYMRRQPLDFDPGARYAYSNFGYCLLGRVIERVSGQSYEQHVCEHVLAPLQIRTMRIGKTLVSGRADGEVRYYTRDNRTGSAVIGEALGAEVPLPYGAWYLEAMDSHGGWIASAVDLVRFGCAIQHPSDSPLLTADSLNAMFARPSGDAGFNEDGSPKDVYYGCGWSVRQVAEDKFNYWHTGSLDGTSTILVLRHDGLCWAVLFNTRDALGDEPPARKIDPLVHQAADALGPP